MPSAGVQHNTFIRKTCADSSCSIVANHFSKKIKRRCTHRFRVLVTRLVAPNNHRHPHKRAYTSANYMTRIYSFSLLLLPFFLLLFCVHSSGCYCLPDCLCSYRLTADLFKHPSLPPLINAETNSQKTGKSIELFVFTVISF